MSRCRSSQASRLNGCHHFIDQLPCKQRTHLLIHRKGPWQMHPSRKPHFRHFLSVWGEWFPLLSPMAGGSAHGGGCQAHPSHHLATAAALQTSTIILSCSRRGLKSRLFPNNKHSAPKSSQGICKPISLGFSLIFLMAKRWPVPPPSRAR